MTGPEAGAAPGAAAGAEALGGAGPVRPGAAPRRATGSLARRITLACLVVAVAAVAVSAAVTQRLIAVTAREATATALAQDADVVASGQVAGRIGDGLAGPAVGQVRIAPDGTLTGTDPEAVRIARRAGAAGALGGAPVSGVVRQGRGEVLVEARATGDGAVALVRPADTPAEQVVRRNLLFAYLAGMVVAVLVGVVLARVLARPLRRTADAARRLRAGQRDVRVPVEGPTEVAEVAGAVNELADALARSEGRQREFLLSVSHELRTPLTAVRGFGESIADGVVTGAAAVAAGRTVVDEAMRLERLVDDLLELARTTADDFRLDLADVDLTGLLAAAAVVWDQRCRAAGVRFSTTAPPGPVVVRTDPRRLRQVLDGLAENALRVTPAGAPLHLALVDGPGGVRLEVRDGGPGIDPADAPDVFRRGALHERYRGARPVGSAGVGLALVHGLVGRMGGTVTAGRAPEGGACFTVTLPRP